MPIAELFEKPKRVRRHFKVALYGKWKTGKTRAALSFPKPVIVDTHRGTDFYDESYDYLVYHATKWTEMAGAVDWVQKRAKDRGRETLIIDDISTIYDDLVNEVSLWRQNKSGSNAPLSTGDWGVIKRRWKAFLMMLVRLDVNVVLVIREKDEYEDSKDEQGRDTRKKTGNVLMDVDKQTSYIFDFTIYCWTEETAAEVKKGTSLKKAAVTSKYLARVEGTRHTSLQKYSIHDVTGKLVYDALFKPMAAEVAAGEEPDQDEPVPPSTEPEEAAAPAAAPARKEPGESAVERMRDLADKFGYPKIHEDDPPATPEDLKVLFTRASAMTWPDTDRKCRRQSCSDPGHKHPAFAGDDGKMYIKGIYNVESTKELRKPQVDVIYGEFGKVLAGLAYLDRDEKGYPFVVNPSGIGEEEVKAKVEHEFSAK